MIEYSNNSENMIYYRVIFNNLIYILIIVMVRSFKDYV